MLTVLIIVIISLLFSAFFSGMEIAFVASNKLRIELEKKQGRFPSRIISFFSKHPGQYIATMLVGNNIALVVYGIFMAILLEPFIIRHFPSDISILIIQTILSTLVILFAAEFLPKTIFRNNPNSLLKIFTLPVLFFYGLLFPLAVFTTWLSNTMLRKIFRVDISKSGRNTVFGKVDIDNFLTESQKDQKKDEEIGHDIKIFQNALDFSSVKLKECIVPRNEIVALEVNKSVEELKQAFIETGFSKILIYLESIDNIIGYVHSLEMFNKPQTIREKLYKLPIVPETMPANKLLGLLTREHKSIALVVDEFGGTAGIVTLEDIVEEIFGEIEDEHDNIELVDKQITDNEYIFSGRLEIDYVNNKYDLSVPESDEYETIAGFILHHYPNIPKMNETIIIDPFEIKILDVSPTRIELISLKWKKQ
jgi:CBS domain containing-hemolysin-like protein